MYQRSTYSNQRINRGIGCLDRYSPARESQDTTFWLESYDLDSVGIFSSGGKSFVRRLWTETTPTRSQPQ